MKFNETTGQLRRCRAWPGESTDTFLQAVAHFSLSTLQRVESAEELYTRTISPMYGPTSYIQSSDLTRQLEAQSGVATSLAHSLGQ